MPFAEEDGGAQTNVTEDFFSSSLPPDPIFYYSPAVFQMKFYTGDESGLVKSTCKRGTNALLMW